MRYLLAFLISIHGLIHLLGFIKAFEFADIPQLSLSISKISGILWLVTSLLFLSSVIFYLQMKHWWWLLALVAAFLSQIVIVMVWNEAKFGSIVNVIIFLVSLSTYATNEFNKTVNKETETLLMGMTPDNGSIITESDAIHLPHIIQKWLLKSGSIGKKKIRSVWLKQKGSMKIKPGGSWMPFVAKQYIDVNHPSFLWKTKVDYKPLINLVGRDKLVNGEGEMLIKLAGLITIVNKKHNEKINQAAMIRFLAEIVWAPSAALNPYITWKSIDNTSAMATFTVHETSVSGIFKFSPNGNVVGFEAQRYYDTEQNSPLETWLIQVKAYGVFEGITVPTKCKVSWKLKEGDFNWLILDITKLKYNIH